MLIDSNCSILTCKTLQPIKFKKNFFLQFANSSQVGNREELEGTTYLRISVDWICKKVLIPAEVPYDKILQYEKWAKSHNKYTCF